MGGWGIMKTNTKIIYIPDFLVVLKSLEDGKLRTAVDIHYDTRISYAHAFNIKKVLLDKGWITMTINGMRHELTLTDKGKEVVQAINMLLDKMGITHDNLVEYRQITKRRKDKKEDIKEEEFVKLSEKERKKVTHIIQDTSQYHGVPNEELDKFEEEESKEEIKEENKQEVVENENINETIL